MARFSRLACAAALYTSIAVLGAAERPRLAVLTDIGADPDDQQSMIRLMVYANEFDLELLIATGAGTPGEMKEAITRPELIRQIVDAYGEVLPNLQRHAAGWPTAESLHERVMSGNPHRGRQYVGAGHDTPASRALIARIDAGTSDRRLNITIWGGQTDLAQALWRVKQDRGTAGLAAFVRKLRVYDIGDQDRIADWMRAEFPGMHYILAKAPAGRDFRDAVYRGMYLTGDASLTSRAWIDEHVRSRGPLGASVPDRDLDGPQPAQQSEGRRHAIVVLLPAARWERSRRPGEARLGWAVRPREGRMVSRRARRAGRGSARAGQPVAAGLSAGLREADGVVRAERSIRLRQGYGGQDHGPADPGPRTCRPADRRPLTADPLTRRQICSANAESYRTGVSRCTRACRTDRSATGCWSFQYSITLSMIPFSRTRGS